MTRQRIVLGIVAIAAIVGIVSGIRAWTFGRSHASTDNAQDRKSVV